MKFDHIAVTQPSGSGSVNGYYQIRAEMLDTPNSNWRRQFQLAWYNSPECRSLCSDVKLDGNLILVQIKDSRQLPATVTALKSLMADTNAHFGPAGSQQGKKSII